jgi:hypothetical protein
MAQDVAGMFDELQTVAERHAELQADRARLEAELDRARQDTAYGVKRPIASAPVSPTCRPTLNIPSGRWRGFRRNWNRRGGRGGGE